MEEKEKELKTEISIFFIRLLWTIFSIGITIFLWKKFGNAIIYTIVNFIEN